MPNDEDLITDLSGAEVEDEEVGCKVDPREVQPSMSDPRWSDYVLSQFTDEETDDEGHPYVHGLRRVARLLIGPVLKSYPITKQCPTFVPGPDGTTLQGADGRTVLQPAVVEHRLVMLNCIREEGASPFEVEVGDVADVYFGNCEPFFARFPTAVASTRAEARCYRKLLLLRKVSAEEVTRVPIEEASVDGFIVPSQISFLNILCQRTDIDAMKFINMGKTKYPSVDRVPHAVAIKMVEHLSGFQNDPGKIPESVRGYKKDWRE